MTDTGSFRFSSTTNHTHYIVGKLIEKGANNSEIHNNIYDTNSYERLQLLGCALRNLKVVPEYRTAYITLKQEELNTYNFRKGDTEGFVNYCLSLKGIIFAAIFIESHQDQIIKISLRSKVSSSFDAVINCFFSTYCAFVFRNVCILNFLDAHDQASRRLKLKVVKNVRYSLSQQNLI